MIYLFTIAFVSYMLALGLVFSRYRAIKAGKVPAAELNQPSLGAAFSQGLDAFAVYIVFFSREALHHGYVYILLLAKRLATFTKKTLVEVERILNRVIHTTKQKRRDGEKGATSLFLKEIKMHQAEIKRGLHS